MAFTRSIDADGDGEDPEGLVPELGREGPLHRDDHQGWHDEIDEEARHPAHCGLVELAELAGREARGHEDEEDEGLGSRLAHGG
jgi:hypothetical protein